MSRACPLAVLTLLALGCEEDPPPEIPAATAAEPSAAAGEGPTWHGEVGAIVEARCAGCHTEGGAGPFPLDSYASASAMAVASLDAIEGGRMPPWAPDPDCRRYQDERVMTDAEKETFRAWVEAGTPEGEAPPTDEAAPTPDVEAPAPDRVATPFEAYLPDETQPDDYRCFPLDVRFDADTFIAGVQVVPGQTAIVHHVLVYVVAEAEAEALDQLDAADEGPGYECFAGPGVGQAGPTAGWVPGAQPVLEPEGVAQLIPAGSRLVMQIHYNVLAAGASLDLTALHLFEHEGEPAELSIAQPQANLTMEVAAGDPASVQVKRFTNRSDEPLVITALTPHMHTLGRELRVELLRADGSEACLVDIDDWDFAWQQSYRFREGEEVVVEPGDTVRLTCVFDNSAANQPVVNGEQLAPRDVAWGEGTYDEMCLNYVFLRRPYRGVETRCDGFEACRAECADPDGFDCYSDCIMTDFDCGVCALEEGFQDGGCLLGCGLQFAAAEACLTECVTDIAGAAGGLGACMRETCAAEYEAVRDCMDPIVESGACAPAMDVCAG